MSNDFKIYSSDEFNRSKFSAHGRVVGKVEGNILVLDLAGPFNQELINSWHQFRLKILEDWRPKRRFGILVRVQQSILLSPAGFNTWEDGVRKTGIQFRPSAQAWAIGSDVEGRSFLVPKIRALYTDLGIPITFFEDDVAARNWLENFLRSADVPR